MATGPEVHGIPAASLSYREARAFIEGLGQGIKPDLTRIRALVELLDHPERTYPTVQVAGTNGKSSTAWMIGVVLAAHNLTTGVYTSPHLQSLRERFLLAGPTEPGDGVAADYVPPEELASVVQYLLPFLKLVEEQVGESPTYFELTTAVAFEWMASHSVAAGVFEVGLGGSWDATNVVAGDVGVLTPIGVDHVAFLGPTPLDNAREKVGIVKPGQRCVSAAQAPDVAHLVRATAERAGVPLAVMGRDFHLRSDRLALGGRLVTVEGPGGGVYEDVFVPLLGSHQARNAALALAACEELVGRPLNGDAVAAGMAAVRAPGRLEVVAREPLVVLDGAHNPQAAAVLGPALEESFGDRRRVLVLSVFEDKDVSGLLSALLPRAAHVLFTRTSSPRAAPPERLAEAAASLGHASQVVEALPEAIETARHLAGDGGMVVVTGSLYLVGEARTVLVGPVE